MYWGRDHIIRIAELWAKGVTAVAIAREFDTTKNAIIGLVHRHKMQRDPGPNSIAIKTKKHQPPQQPKSASRGIPQVQECDKLIPLPQRKSIWQLAVKDCRWPVGHPDAKEFFFCGAVKKDGSPYCVWHSSRAYSSPQNFEQASDQGGLQAKRSKA